MIRPPQTICTFRSNRALVRHAVTHALILMAKDLLDKAYALDGYDLGGNNENTCSSTPNFALFVLTLY